MDGADNASVVASIVCRLTRGGPPQKAGPTQKCGLRQERLSYWLVAEDEAARDEVREDIRI